MSSRLSVAVVSVRTFHVSSVRWVGVVRCVACTTSGWVATEWTSGAMGGSVGRSWWAGFVLFRNLDHTLSSVGCIVVGMIGGFDCGFDAWFAGGYIGACALGIALVGPSLLDLRVCLTSSSCATGIVVHVAGFIGMGSLSELTWVSCGVGEGVVDVSVMVCSWGSSLAPSFAWHFLP